ACFGSYAAAVERGIDIVLAEAQLHFRAPARFEDELALEVAVTHLGTTSVVTEHACRRDGELLVQGTLRHVTVDPATLRKAPMPDWFRTALARWGVA
ncbi:MAG TPA: thioesterase family protein, partial [Solirubrobacteraceae bacterium]|nr:thioesterase family protein [Solirubrobacteraceae bacterium]